MSSSAADEFARMTSGSKGEGSLPHPEDILEQSQDKQSDHPHSDNNSDSTGLNSDIEEEDEIDDIANSSEDSDRKPSSSKKTTYIHKKKGSIAPSIRPASTIIDTMPQFRLTSYGTANTGPKGVLADARSYEIAKRRELQAKQAMAHGYKPSVDLPATAVQARLLDDRLRHSDNSDDDDELMQAWRQKRLQELKAGSSFNRKKVATGRQYGRMETVDANGYLDAIEKVTANTIVVVLIYDERSSESQFVEDCIGTLARRHVATRFVKLHHSEAEMDKHVVPALLAYKAGELIVNLPRVIDEIPTGRTLSSESLESLLKKHNALTGSHSKSSSTLTSAGSRTSLYNWDDE
ncbi:hypothetical protein DRE_01755 [Drechslerella stenobrocha 248]|uniref:Phosducin domain-containing protein n=1 Tax=Drechslerella stenobrocha 248 TaxID=1043628 RepID=W7I8B7_9PEZI|nr:hypothetical protein DRE_01755 [Drechslerella stenobrocha 248]